MRPRGATARPTRTPAAVPRGTRRWSLTEAVGRLVSAAGPPNIRRDADPFRMILWENVAYLVDDERRGEVFEELRRRVGLEPRAILSAPEEALVGAVRNGGMRPADRAERLRACAEIALEIGEGALRKAVAGDPALARKLLKRFPGIADPGADRILLYNRRLPTLAPDSNVLRVLVRLGFGRPEKDYGRTYRSAAEAVAPELPADFGILIRARETLRRHGQVLCRRNAPHCDVCPLAARCPALAAGSFPAF
ncbi:MAG TPA: hypothetical protein VFL12_05465 [Thermoanaerobaculia bacterium]|nr:hypothetical protein [Thermoanaerobaculia bacterium]